MYWINFQHLRVFVSLPNWENALFVYQTEILEPEFISSCFEVICTVWNYYSPHLSLINRFWHLYTCGSLFLDSVLSFVIYILIGRYKRVNGSLPFRSPQSETTFKVFIFFPFFSCSLNVTLFTEWLKTALLLFQILLQRCHCKGPLMKLFKKKVFWNPHWANPGLVGGYVFSLKLKL